MKVILGGIVCGADRLAQHGRHLDRTQMKMVEAPLTDGLGKETRCCH
jgi:hypothetical protein